MSLLPSFLMHVLDFRPSERGAFTIEQAGIAKQTFQAVEAYITAFLEDKAGHRTNEFELLVWLADASDILLGFDGVLESAVLHLDMLNLSGYLEFL